MVLTKATTVTDIAFQTEKLVTAGNLTLADLSLPKKELKKKLETSKYSKRITKNLLQNKDVIKNILKTKQIFLEFACSNSGKIEDDLVNFLNDKESYHHSLFFGEFSKVSYTYFAFSTDSMLKTVNPATMTPKELKSLIKNADKLGITVTDRIVLKELYRNKIAEKTKQRINQNRKVAILKQKAETVRRTTKRVGNKAVMINNQRKKISRKIKSEKNKTMHIIKKPIKLVTSPVSMLSSIFFNVRDFFRRKLVLPIAGAVLIFILIYIVLIGISGLAMSLIDKSKEVVFLTSEDMQKLVDHLNEKTETVYEKALEQV